MTALPLPAPGTSRQYRATLRSSERITSAESPEEVRQLRFRCDDLGFDGRLGQCIRILAPGQFGNPYHARLYSLADVDRSDPAQTDFTLCVRRCQTLDDFNGEAYPGVASNYLCDLAPGDDVLLDGPIGYPFVAPEDPHSPLLMIGMGTGIAPFRGLIRSIYESRAGWAGPVRLFFGARSGLELLYMNEQNRDLALYFDQPTFQAFQAVSPRPHFGEPAALDRRIAEHAKEIWSMLEDDRTCVYLAGSGALLSIVEKPLAEQAGNAHAYHARRNQLKVGGRWIEVLY